MSSPSKILFQPIIDTEGYRILGHFCDASRMVDAAILAAAEHPADALYFIRFCGLNPRCNTIRDALRESALRPANTVFEIPLSAIVKDPKCWSGVYDSYRNAGFGLALTGAGSTPRATGLLRDLRPEFVKLDKTIVRNVERLSCAMTIRGLADMAEEWEGRVIADGVERLFTVENLWLLSVYLMQGPLLGRPAPEIAREDSQELTSLARALALARIPADGLRAAHA